MTVCTSAHWRCLAWPCAKVTWCMFRHKAAVKSHDTAQSRTAQNFSDSLILNWFLVVKQSESYYWSQRFHDFYIMWSQVESGPRVLRSWTLESYQCLVRSVGDYSQYLRTHLRFHWSAPWTTLLTDVKLSPHSLSLDIKSTQLVCRAWRHDHILAQKENRNLRKQTIMDKPANTTWNSLET